MNEDDFLEARYDALWEMDDRDEEFDPYDDFPYDDDDYDEDGEFFPEDDLVEVPF